MKKHVVDFRGDAGILQGLIRGRTVDMTPGEQAAAEAHQAQLTKEVAEQDAKILVEKVKRVRLENAVQALLEKGILVPSDLEEKEPIR
jgi:hypothetical protein